MVFPHPMISSTRFRIRWALAYRFVRCRRFARRRASASTPSTRIGTFGMATRGTTPSSASSS